MANEVLVHVSTPATHQNDELFRSLANAYIDFEPYRTHCDEAIRQRARVEDQLQLQPTIPPTEARAFANGELANPSEPTASKESYGSFPSIVPWGENSFDGDGSVRLTSRLAQLDRSYLNWRNGSAPKSSFARIERVLDTSSDRIHSGASFIEDSQSALHTLQSQLQDIYSATSTDHSEDDGGGEDEGLVEHYSQSVHVYSRARPQESGTAKERPLPALPDETAQDDLIVSTLHESMSLPAPSTSALDDGSMTFTNEGDFSKLPIDAFPPPPITSIVQPEALPSQITKHLAAIKTRNPTRFMPLKVKRDLKREERGFWRMNCSRWSLDAQRDFWSSLCEHICSGRVGWAITLHRENEIHKGLGIIRVYCWGEVVEHMWLLLWLCSKGKASGMGSEWIDANGIAVIEMA